MCYVNGGIRKHSGHISFCAAQNTIIVQENTAKHSQISVLFRKNLLQADAMLSFDSVSFSISIHSHTFLCQGDGSVTVLIETFSIMKTRRAKKNK